MNRQEQEHVREILKKYLLKSKAMLLVAAKEVWSFLSSPIFLKNFGALLATGFLLVFLTNKWLGCYTHHGEAIPVPDFVGLSIDEAQKAAAENEMQIVVRDSIWVENQKGGIVLPPQEPSPGSFVKRNRKVYVRISRETPDEVALPELTGIYDFEQYQRQLSRRKLKLKIKERTYHPKYAENTILHLEYNGKIFKEDDLRGGKVKVPKGSTIYAVVTRRTADFVNVPDLICLTLSEAQLPLNAANLKQDLIKDASVSEEGSAIIWKQEPEPGVRIQPGNTIKIYLTQSPPDNCL